MYGVYEVHIILTTGIDDNGWIEIYYSCHALSLGRLAYLYFAAKRYLPGCLCLGNVDLNAISSFRITWMVESGCHY